MITQSINLNLIPGGVLPRINVSQYDKGSRTLQFVLFNGPVLYSIESGTEITIQGSKPDKTAFQYSCTWSGSTASMDIEQQMTAVAGDVICELVISNNGEILGTCNFILNVESAAVSDDTVISETELPLIERAVEAAVEAAASAASAAQSAEDASGYVETVQTAAQNAAQSATAASSSAGTAQTAAQSAAQSATDASSSAGTAQTAAQSAAQSATDASSSAGTAQTAAQNAAQSATDASGSANSASQSATAAAASAQAAAQSAASIGIATTSNAGIVKPDGTTITIDQDGTIHGNASVTVDSALSTTSVNPVQNKVITSALGKVKEIIAPVETDPATNAWAVGRQIIFNDDLYEVIAAISAGDALVAYEDDPTSANIKLADPVETQLLNEESTRAAADLALQNNLSNRNLLDNGWFTVNQRGSSSYNTTGNTVDRWRLTNNNGSLAVSDAGITLTAGSTNEYFQQRFENADYTKLIGKQVTLSILMQDGTLHSVTGIVPSVPSSTPSSIGTISGPYFNATSAYVNSSGLFFVQIGVESGHSLAIRAVKLELGSISTLAMDTAPNYAEELLKCQRYFIRYRSTSNCAIGFSNSSTTAMLVFFLPCPMASSSPTLSYSGTPKVEVSGQTGSGGIDVTNVVFNTCIQNAVRVFAYVDSGLTPGNGCSLHLRDGAYIDLSAEL